jgi:hypothetical protein
VGVKEPRSAILPGGPADPPGLTNPWLKLSIGFALILFFIFGIGSLSKFIPGARRMGEVIEEYNLRATAVYYTDFDESYNGSEYIRHSLESRTGKP